MKKTVFTFALSLLLSLGAMAQSKNEARALKTSKAKIELIEKTVKLSDSEKETYIELSKAYVLNHLSLRDLKQSDPAAFKSGIKENNADFKNKLTAAFGKEKATEIMDASKKKKKNGKKKKNKKN
ncbi:hypothetical protein [Flavicella sediminum]|uniref:hypothetical protein n=1 Tax=Flavicella sediminum TaxID=2585141 RepID=UPI00111EC346|nr:hypothetical protein [Flavicella sediminum]